MEPYKGKIGPGTIISYAQYNPKLISTSYKEVFGKLQQIFTRGKWTHTALGFFPILGIDNDTLFESNEIQNITLWNPHGTIEYRIYDMTYYSEEQIEKALKYVFKKYNGELYGFFQLLYFVRRYIWETEWIKKYFSWIPRLFGMPEDVRKWNNWFTSGIVCSELFYIFMQKLNEMKFHPEVQEALNKWNGNNFHSTDANDFMEAFPEIFEVKYHKPGGIKV